MLGSEVPMRTRLVVLLVLASLSSGTARAYDVLDAHQRPRRDPFDPSEPGVAVCEVPPPEWCASSQIACADLKTLRLTGVLVDTASPRAVFEDSAQRGTVVRVGDVVSNSRVKAIHRDRVVLERLLVRSTETKLDVVFVRFAR